MIRSGKVTGGDMARHRHQAAGVRTRIRAFLSVRPRICRFFTQACRDPPEPGQDVAMQQVDLRPVAIRRRS
jgi:hypothetical protein